MKRKISCAIILAFALAACSAPAIQPPSPTLAPPSPRVATISAPAPTQPIAATPVPPTQAAQLLSPECFTALPLTPAQTEGPYFKANSPERKSLVEPGMTGTKIPLTGLVMTRDCKAIARAKVDVWQTDDKGEYDNAGYRMRGHVFSDATGRYAIETIIPGLYTGRTRHIHVKVVAPNQPALTTQLYFPDEAQNQRDSIFDRALLVKMQDTPSGKIGAFNFVTSPR